MPTRTRARKPSLDRGSNGIGYRNTSTSSIVSRDSLNPFSLGQMTDTW